MACEYIEENYSVESEKAMMLEKEVAIMEGCLAGNEMQSSEYKRNGLI